MGWITSALIGDLDLEVMYGRDTPTEVGVSKLITYKCEWYEKKGFFSIISPMEKGEKKDIYLKSKDGLKVYCPWMGNSDESGEHWIWMSNDRLLLIDKDVEVILEKEFMALKEELAGKEAAKAAEEAVKAATKAAEEAASLKAARKAAKAAEKAAKVLERKK